VLEILAALFKARKARAVIVELVVPFAKGATVGLGATTIRSFEA